MSGTGAVGMTMPSLRPHSKISIPEACAPSNMDANGIVAPASETATGQGEKQAEEVTVPPQAPATASAAATVPLRQKSSRAFKPISPGLSNISLPLGPSPKVRGGKDDASSVRIELVKPAAEKVETPPEKPVEAKVGDLVELFMGRGHVRVVREDGMLEVWAMGWEMAGEQIPRFYVRKDAVKVVPTVYYKMPELERLQSAAWLKQEGGKLFKAAKYQEASERYMKAIGILKTSEFKSNAQNARALEVMIPCHNNAATCYIKLKNYGDARLLSENVDTLCAALDRNREGMVMKALKERGVGETTILGQWWCKGLFLGGKACLYQAENDQAVACLKKGSKLCKPASLAKLRVEINNELEKATRRLASQTKKAQKMWTKAFSKNSTDPVPETSVGTSRELPTPAVASNGSSQSSVLQRLEDLAKMNGTSFAPEAIKPAKEEEEDEEEEEEEGSDEDDDYEEEEGAISTSGLIWGSLAIGAVAVSVAALVAVARRR
eukprot:jgi/Undpi1/8848/HiC_scaffold_25.g11310.m1